MDAGKPRGRGRGPTAPYTAEDAPQPYTPTRNNSPAAGARAAATAAAPTHLYQGLSPHFLLPDGTPDYLRLILSADIYSLVKNTPLDPAINLSTRLGVDVLLKREDLQPVFSFKLRGAFNMMRQLPEDQKWKGVIACSAGNHAQGVALSGAHLSIPCTIVMPLNTPTIKTANVARLGAKVVLHGQDFDEAKAECSRLANQYGLAIIPPFDEPRVIAGQGTVAVEICRQTDMSKIDAIFCCVGGGGLIAGVAAYVKRICPPHVKVIGVETYDGDALARSLEKGERVTLDEVGQFSDGTAVRIVGEECFRVAKELVDGVVRVSTDEICAAIRDIFEDTRSIPEPAGALAVAGMKRYVETQNLRGSKQRFVALVSGANMNFSRLRFVADRAELGDKNEVLLSVAIPERPGSFLKLHSVLHPRAVTEFSYRYNDPDTAHIYISFQLSGKMPAGEAMPVPAAGVNGIASTPVSGASTPISATGSTAVPPTLSARAHELSSILSTLEQLGMPATDLSDNELAKSHARYMVGGLVAPRPSSQSGSRSEEHRKKVLDKERLFSFEFPERPGALRKFLTTLHPSSDITLFHYRDHGGDVAKVLAGIRVEEGAEDGFQRWLDGEGKDGLGYPWREETDNDVYRKFWR